MLTGQLVSHLSPQGGVIRVLTLCAICCSIRPTVARAAAAAAEGASRAAGIFSVIQGFKSNGDLNKVEMHQVHNV